MLVTAAAPAPAAAGGFGAVVRDLARQGEAVAVVTEDGRLTYAELARRIDETAARLGRERRLVLVAGGNELDPLVTYLAALSAGCPALLVPGDDDAALDALVAAYDPDVVLRRVRNRWRLTERRPGTAHDLHPDLALLLSTSGSTGSPKLVRLSHANLLANAEQIAQYLGITAADRAVTTLPLHYCYGLSVVHSHLLRGAALVLTPRSVVDAEFWALAGRAGATSLAGVPHTFELLDRSGADLALPSLRYVTAAGGRLPEERVRAYAELGRRSGFELFVMYGQTEATARMAYLPPELAASRPGAVGVPVPGGTFRLDPVPESDEPGVGELVYTGPNVMMGYARSPADLRLGPEITELRTGDLARRAPDGLYEVVGRRSRFAKVLGLRVDLEHVEHVLAGRGVRACAVEADGEVVVAVAGSAPARLHRRAARACGLPPHLVRLLPVPDLPRLPTGKPDLAAVRALSARPGVGAEPAPSAAMARPAQPAVPDQPAQPPVPAQRAGPDRPGPGGRPAPTVADLRRIYADVLDRRDVHDDSTFVQLGGDSLSYVEASVRLEEALGVLPADWATTPLRDLAAAQPSGSGRWLDLSVALRAVAIVLIVGSHANVFTVLGGAHLLVAVAGHNVARFALRQTARGDRVRALLRCAARVAVPSIAVIAGAQWLTGQYGVANLALLNDLLGPDVLGPQWQFWFVEVLVHLLLALGALLAVPAVHDLERRWPFGAAMAVFGAGLLTRFGVVPLEPGPEATQTAVGLVWLFALGWASARATTVGRRVVVTAAALLSVPGATADPAREALVLAGVLLLVWASRVPSPRVVRRLAGLLASSSLYTYLTHWQVFPHLQDSYPLLALASSLVVGVACWSVARRVPGWLTAAGRAARSAAAPALLPAAPVPVSVPYPSRR